MPFPAVVLLIVALCCSLAPAQTRPAATRPAAVFTKNVQYGTAGGVKLLLDASVPATPGPHPAVILVHGGAWQMGDKTNFLSLFDPLTRAGYAWFSVNYRLAPKHRFPACVDDVETAVKWVKENAARFGIDPARVALLGESAGGHLVELAVARSPADSPVRPAAVVAMYAPSDLPALAVTAEARGVPVKKILAALFGRTEMDAAAVAELKAASPLSHVKAGLPPFLLLHGTADKLVPIAQSTAFQAALQSVGVPCDLITVQGGPHGMFLWNLIDPTYRDKILAFLDTQLKP